MKRYILLFTFIFAALLNAQAQKDPCNGNPRPIEVFKSTLNPATDKYDAVTLPHNPCEQAVNIYMILKANPGATVNWKVVQSEMSTAPAEGWIVVDKDNHNAAGGAEGFELIEPGPNGKTYFAAAIRSGRKAGVIKATITDPTCGTGTKVATLTVRPGLLPVTLTEACTGAVKTFTATATPSKQPNSVTGYTNTWIFPNYWTYTGTGTVTAGPTGYSMVTTAGVNTASFTTIPDPDPSTTEYVTVEVVALYKGNNGQGVGNANCDFGTAEIVATPCEGGEEPDCVITTEDGLFTFAYLGETTSSTNSTLSFSFKNNTGSAMNMVMIEVLGSPTSLTPVAPAGFTADFDAESGIITYTRTDGETAGNETELFGFTLPTAHHELFPFYTLSVFTIEGDFGVTGFNTNTCDDTPIEALGVELSSFEGKATASGIQLSWTTASEENNDRFEIQRSTNGKEFTTIGTVKGAGNSSTSLSYSFTDSKAAKGANYYRINQVDFDGTATLTKVIAIESNGAISTTAISLYPNPATSGNVNIALAGEGMSNKTFAVIITDMNGRTVFQQEINTSSGSEINIPLDQSKISKGLYMVKVQGDNLVETQKLIIR